MLSQAQAASASGMFSFTCLAMGPTKGGTRCFENLLVSRKKLYQTSFSSMLQAVAMFCLIKKLHEATPFLYKQISIKSSARVAIFLTRIAIRNCSDDIQIFLNCLWVVINSVCHSSAGNMQFQLLSFSEYILSANFSFHLSKSLWPIGNGQQLWLSGSEI